MLRYTCLVGPARYSRHFDEGRAVGVVALLRKDSACSHANGAQRMLTVFRARRLIAVWSGVGTGGLEEGVLDAVAGSRPAPTICGW